MEPHELRRRRKALGLTQASLAARLGLSPDFIGLMERGAKPIVARTADAVRHMTPRALDRKPQLTDPMERIIEAALIDAGVRFVTDAGGGTDHRLDFHLPDHGLAIEVKRFYSARSGEQIARAPHVILAQGEVAVRALAAMIRSGGLTEIALSKA